MVLSLSLKQLVQIADNRTSLKDHNYEHILEHFSHIKGLVILNFFSPPSSGDGVSDLFDVRSFEVTRQTFFSKLSL